MINTGEEEIMLSCTTPNIALIAFQDKGVDKTVSGLSSFPQNNMKKIELSQNNIIEDLESPQASEMISRLNGKNIKIDSNKVPKIFDEHFT